MTTEQCYFLHVVDMRGDGRDARVCQHSMQRARRAGDADREVNVRDCELCAIRNEPSDPLRSPRLPTPDEVALQRAAPMIARAIRPGSAVASLTAMIGIEPCAGCREREPRWDNAVLRLVETVRYIVNW